ncbi:hypothetical protein SUGI_0223210 [Cryptomeria japonica]|nr:hypothetical protein SUGI_0223210 [Cryptomeria japonica]
MAFLFVMMLLCTLGSAEPDKKLYVVYMGSNPSKSDVNSLKATSSVYLGMLKSVHGSYEEAKKSLRVSYGKSFRGFAAMLSPSYVQRLSDMHGVVSVFESKNLQPLTTRSWDFIGFPASAQTNHLDYQSDIIIGLVDSGIWPESESFIDKGIGPIPSKWRGGCNTTSGFPACNRKLVGAKFYRSSLRELPTGEYLSPRDSAGHGTHTSSTAAGNFIKNASLYGIAQGESRGGVPGARVAMYKACWSYRCNDADILAAIDDAIYDGVDILSVSIGFIFPRPYFQDSIAIGAFHAMKRGILLANSAGNSGPDIPSVINNAPWSLTVAASSIDRKMKTQILLGNKISIMGIAINTYTMEKQWYPLVYGGDVANVSGGFTSANSSYCQYSSLDHKKVKGKIVICNTDYLDSPDHSVYLADGVGAILISDASPNEASTFLNPASSITSKQAKIVLSYVNSTRSPVAKIKKTANSNGVAPIVASFSSRGYNPFTLDILKPDITAPGLEILASFIPNISISGWPEDKRRSNFNIMSGTSMSCPHAAGVAGFVKSYHQDWSPAAIKSALMTTAFELDSNLPGNRDAEFGYGAGQINPMKAIDPGLVYDAGVNDYMKMLCMDEAYNDTTLRLVTGDYSSCANITKVKNGARELNYPSIMVFTAPGRSFQAEFLRTVTNVGVAKSALSWSYAKYTVRSPISVFANSM